MFPDLTRDDVFRLETRRMWLRWPRLADVQAILRLAGDKRIAEMTAQIPHPMTQQDAENFVFNARQQNANGDALVMVMTPKSRPNAVIGVVSIQPSVDVELPHLGYWVGVPCWGQGYATEAIEAMVDAFFIFTSEQELTAVARVENDASKRVLAKTGMVPNGNGLIERPAHGDFVQAEHFRLDRTTWSRQLPWVQPYGITPPIGPVLAEMDCVSG